MINLQNLAVNDNIIIYVNTLDADIPFDSNTFLFGFKNGFTHVWTYVVPTIIIQNTRYTKFSITLVNIASEDPDAGLIMMSPEGNWDYKLWATPELTLSPDFGYVIDEGQAYLENTVDEIQNIVYISDNEPERNIVYLTRDESACNKWNTDTDQWNFAVQKWNECN
jgi:hypothetical protein